MREPKEQTVRKSLAESLGHWSSPTRAMAVFVSVLVLLGLFYLLAYEPYARRKAELESSLDGLNAAAAERRRTVAARTELDGIAPAVEAAAIYAKTFLPAENEMPRLIQLVSELGERSGLRVTGFAPKLPAVVKDDYAEIPFSLSLSGPFPAVLNFFYSFSLMDRMVTISEFKFTSPKLIEGDMVLTVECVGATYRALTAEETENQQRQDRKF